VLPKEAEKVFVLGSEGNVVCDRFKKELRQCLYAFWNLLWQWQSKIRQFHSLQKKKGVLENPKKAKGMGGVRTEAIRTSH